MLTSFSLTHKPAPFPTGEGGVPGPPHFSSSPAAGRTDGRRQSHPQPDWKPTRPREPRPSRPTTPWRWRKGRGFPPALAALPHRPPAPPSSGVPAPEGSSRRLGAEGVRSREYLQRGKRNDRTCGLPLRARCASAPPRCCGKSPAAEERRSPAALAFPAPGSAADETTRCCPAGP